MKAINPFKAGLACGALVAAMHALWALMIALGWAQPILDFVFWMHFLRPVFIIMPFNIGIALILIAVTGASGFIIGWLFGMFWNRLHLN